MGIKFFYILSIIYGIVTSLGLFSKNLSPQFLYISLIIIAVYFLFYTTRKKIEFFYSIFGVIIVNLSVQLTGGLNSPLFLLYFLILPIIGHKDTYMNYWIIALCMLSAEVLSSVVHVRILVLPLLTLAFAILILGIVIKKKLGYEHFLQKNLAKYEAREQFYRAADFESKSIVTSVRNIDLHKGIERPLLYFVKFVHSIFNAHTTAIFSYNNDNLVLVQGFSRSELFRPDAVMDIKSGIYHQAISEQKAVLIKEFIHSSEVLGYYRGELKISSVIIKPIILVDQVEGMFVIDRSDSHFNEDDKKLFDEATNAVGYFLAMLRLYEKERYETQYLSAIAELAKELQRELDLKLILSDTIKSLRIFMKCDDVSIAKIDEINNNGVVIRSTYIKEDTKFSLDDGLVGFIGRHKNPIIKDDLHEGNLVVLKKDEKTNNASFVGAPIKQDDELLGVIWLEDHRKRKFTKDDIEALNILSSQLSLAWQRAKLYYKVKDLSIRDGLTELYNHRHFQEILEEEINRSKELVLIFFDIDHFKYINDTYGHLAGDEVLKYLGKLISRTGIAARYGGEEFAIILPNCSIKEGAEIAVRLKDHLKKSEIKFNQIQIKITISIGIAHYPTDAETRLELIERADKALYKAKETGRDRIVIAQSINNGIQKP